MAKVCRSVHASEALVRPTIRMHQIFKRPPLAIEWSTNEPDFDHSDPSGLVGICIEVAILSFGWASTSRCRADQGRLSPGTMSDADRVTELEAAGVNGVLTDDERRAVAAANQLGLLLSSQWPDVAAHLLAQGAQGEAVAELAGLSQTASWAVDQLVPQVLSDLAIPELTYDQAGEVIARLVGHVATAREAVDDFAAVRVLAQLGPALDYPGGVIGDAYYASEWLDCECHAGSHERDAAVALERRFRSSDPLAVDAQLLAAMSAHWI